MENNSRTYLQGLFNRFPSSASALYGSANDDNDSDGEYPIYEQESNALDDDEEDDEWRSLNITCIYIVNTKLGVCS